MQNNSRRKFIQSAAVLTTGFMANGFTSKAFYVNEFTSKSHLWQTGILLV